MTVLSLTFEEAKDEVLAFFKEGWDTTSLAVVYEQVPADEPLDKNSPYAQIFFRLGYGRQSGFGDGQKTYERNGSIQCEIRTPAGKGLSDSLPLVKVVVDSFEGKHTPGGVWFRTIDIQNLGQDGLFYVTSVMIYFKFNEVK